VAVLVLFFGAFSFAAEPTQNYDSDFLTPQMIKAAAPPFAVPYADDKSNYVTNGGRTVYRPNHGLAQGARVATIAQDLISSILANPKPNEMQIWLKTKLQSDPNFSKQIALAALSHRTGRTDESESIGNPAKRPVELATSAADFEKSAAAAGVAFTPTELADFKKAIQLDGQGSSNADIGNTSKLLRAAHIFDLIRMGLQKDDEVASRLPDLPRSEITKIFGRAQAYLAATGAAGTYTSKFFEVSNNSEALAHALKAAHAPTEDTSDFPGVSDTCLRNSGEPGECTPAELAQISEHKLRLLQLQRGNASASTTERLASNCSVRQLPSSLNAPTKYKSLLRAEYVADDGVQSVEFLVVPTNDLQASDDDLFGTAGVLRKSAKPAARQVLHGPTAEGLDSLVNATTCEDWVHAGALNQTKPAVPSKFSGPAGNR